MDVRGEIIWDFYMVGVGWRWGEVVGGGDVRDGGWCGG